MTQADRNAAVDFFRRNTSMVAAALVQEAEDRRFRTRSGRLNAVGAAELTARVMAGKPSGRRAGAARELAEDAGPLCRAGIVAALRDRSPRVWQAAVDGLLKALREKRVRRALAPELFDLVAPLLRRKHNSVDRTASVLYQLDASRAASAVAGVAVANGVVHPGVADLLAAVNAHRAMLPDDVLDRLADHLGRKPAGYPWTRAAGELLVALARANSQSARPLIDDAINHPDALSADREYQTEGAARAAAVLAGIEDPWARAHDVASRNGLAALGPHQRNVYLSAWFLFERNNGGLSQFIWNSSRAEIVATPAALEAVGARRAADQVRRGIKLFGRGGVPSDVERKHARMRATGGPDPWDELEAGGYEPIEALAVLYAVRHAGHFRDGLVARRTGTSRR